MMNKTKKILFAFDMDHTILSGNSDYVFLHLLSAESKTELKAIKAKSNNWAKYMQSVYLKLKRDNTNIDKIKETIQAIPLNPGYKELFDFLRLNQERFENIIISGANTLFIKWVLEKHNLGDIFQQYYSNFAEEDNECLIKIHPHHDHQCSKCDESQCKNLILEGHIHNAINSNEYEKIIYAGDGSNDYCPSLLLKENDYLFPRVGFALHDLLYENEGLKDLKCEVYPWHDGYIILEEIKKLI